MALALYLSTISVLPILTVQGALVLIPQVPRSAAVRTDIPRSAPLPTQGRTAIPRATVEACRRAQLGAKAPEGVDCREILILLAAEQRRTPEGTLLSLLGQRSNITQSSSVRPANGADANNVARDVAAGTPQGDAAAIASRQRASPPPAGPR